MSLQIERRKETLFQRFCEKLFWRFPFPLPKSLVRRPYKKLKSLINDPSKKQRILLIKFGEILINKRYLDSEIIVKNEFVIFISYETPFHSFKKLLNFE